MTTATLSKLDIATTIELSSQIMAKNEWVSYQDLLDAQEKGTSLQDLFDWADSHILGIGDNGLSKIDHANSTSINLSEL